MRIAAHLAVGLAVGLSLLPLRLLVEDPALPLLVLILLGSAAAVGASLGGGLDLLPWPKVDFAKFGEIEVKPLSRIKKISGQNLARNWVMIPAVTYHEDADITDLEAFRVAMNKEHEKSGKKLTMLAFIIKASVRALQEFPEFNTSLDGDNLVYKKYFNIAFAADTPNGLVVPVLRDADKMTFAQVENAYCRLLDASSGTEVARFNLSDKGRHTGVVMAYISRTAAGWDLTAIGTVANGRTAQDLATDAAQAVRS